MDLKQENFQNEDAIQIASEDKLILKNNYENNLINSNDKNEKEELFIFQNQNYYSKNQILEINKKKNLEKKNNDSYKEGSINFETIIKMDEFNEQQNLLNNNQNKNFKIDNYDNQHSNQCLNQQQNHNKTIINDYQHHHHHHHHQSHSLNNHSLDLVFRSIYVSIPTNNSSNLKKTINEDMDNNKSKTFISKILNKFSNNEKISKNIIEKKQLNPTLEVQNKRDILSNVSGYAKPGQLLAIMGPSGSGKTTLLNTLSGRLKARKGLVTINGLEFGKQMKRKIGYVLQNDVFFAGLTLKQTLIYTALLRMPDSVSRVDKLKHVQHVIELLDLTNCENTIIGDIMNRGLSGGEKKRASIACELLTNPSIMLLDEPTSGLDSSTAFSLMKSLKDYAIKESKTIIATIHQPSSQTFYLFDKLLLLVNGQMAYFGKSTHVVPFFEGLGYTISPHYNPADIMMEKIKQKEELPKILKAAKYLIKNCSVLSHAKGTSVRKNSFKLNKAESHDWSIVKLKVDLENNHQNFHHHHHHYNNHHHLASIEENPQTNYEINVRNMINKEQFNGLEDNEKTDDLKDNKYKNRQFINNSQQHHHLHKISISNTYPYETPEKELCDSCCKKNCKISFRLFNDDDSGRSSWIETDHSSTATFSSNNSCSSSTCSTEDVYSEVNFELDTKSAIKTINASDSSRNDSFHKSKWPTSFFTQVDVLTRRNFCESRHRMLSKLNWIQTIGLGILSGLMWFQLNRSESTLNDVRGFLFFSASYWMLFAWFGALISIQPEREIMNKERSSGAYRLSAFYLAKMIGELPLIITLPSLYFFICYPMFAVNLNINNFLLQWFFMVLSALVAQSIGLFIGLATMSLEISITVSAIYSTAINLFGGYYSASLPYWLSWMRYTSILHYAFQNMQATEFSFGGPIRCANTNSKYSYCLKQIVNLTSKVIDNNSIQLLKINQSIIESTKHNLITNDSINDANLNDQNLFIPYNELISELNGNDLTIWSNIGILICFLCFFRVMGYLVLRFVHTPK